MPFLPPSTSKPSIYGRPPTWHWADSRGANPCDSKVIAKAGKPTSASGWTGQATPTRTARKQHREPYPPRHSLQDRHSPPMCAQETRCASAPTTTGATCGASTEPPAHRALLCSRAQMSWRHDVIAETWQAMLDSRPTSNKKQQRSPQESVGRCPTTIAEASLGTSQCTWTWS